MKKNYIIVVLSIITVITLTACGQTDIVGKIAKTSFKEMVEAIPDQVVADEMNGGWSLSAPDGTAKFIWSKNYNQSSVYDVMLEFDSAPFIAAGLDVTKLPEGIVSGDKILLGKKLGDDKLTYSGEATPSASFDKIVELYRDSIGYHEKLDHYGVDLDDGNKFEWAKDMSTNDKDIVFVVDPQIFINAGVDLENVEGWVYTSVEVKDSTGKTVDVMKLLKPFNIQ